MEVIKSYRDLIVWKKSVDLAHEVYALTTKFPRQETYGLASQMQRAAVSIPANIAEGQSRNHTKEFIQFLGTAFGSSAELETEVIIAKREYPQFDYSKIENLSLEVRKMLSTLIRKLTIH